MKFDEIRSSLDPARKEKNAFCENIFHNFHDFVSWLSPEPSIIVLKGLTARHDNFKTDVKSDEV